MARPPHLQLLLHALPPPLDLVLDGDTNHIMATAANLCPHAIGATLPNPLRRAVTGTHCLSKLNQNGLGLALRPAPTGGENPGFHGRTRARAEGDQIVTPRCGPTDLHAVPNTVRR